MTRTAPLALALTAALLATAAPAAAVTLDGARAKALAATRAERARGGVILFSLRTPVRRLASIREAGRRPAPAAGSSTRTMRRILAPVAQPAYFFYLDRGAHQASEHSGRVLLVGARTGRVVRSRLLAFAPTVDGRLPVFLRTQEGYESGRYRVSSSQYAVPGASARAVRAFGAFGAATPRSVASESLVASRLAAERSCTVTVGGRRSASLTTLGSASRSPILPLLAYRSSVDGSLASFVTSKAIAEHGCRDILIAISGDGYRSLPVPTVRAELRTSGARMSEYHVSTTALRSIIVANPSVTFKLMIDAPGSGGFVEALRSLSNVLVIATSSGAGQTAYRYLPSKRIGATSTPNPLSMRTDSSFFTTLLFGGAAFASSDAEVGHAVAEVTAGRAPSFLAYMIARAFELSRPFDFTADLGATQRLHTRGFTPTPPGPSNGAPAAAAATAITAEDAATPITLAGTDPDGDPLTFAIATAPAHGALSGTGPNLTYTANANYNGPDSFTFTVSDGALTSAAATVSITVSAVDDPPLTVASGTLAYTENDPPAAVAPALSVADIDSTGLTGATVQITGNYVSGDDLLALPGQPAITAGFDPASGTLVLSGGASVAAYEAALRAVTYANADDDPGNAARTVTFRSRDAGGFGPAATRTITIAPVNDAPAITTSTGPLSFAEGDPPTPIDSGLVLTDPDSQITGATVRITANHTSPEDVLALPAQANITGSYDSGTGTLTLTGTDSVAAYQAALRAVTYRNTSSTPSTATRTASFQATDTVAAASNVATRNIAVSASDNAPDVANSSGSLAYTENDPPTAIDTTITVTDPDSVNLTGATVQITSNYVQGEDILALPAQSGITAVFAPASGLLTLSGVATVAAYEAALEAVTYRNTSDNPSTAPRTVTYQASDATGFGTADTHAITIAAVDDPPVAVKDAATVAEDSGPSAVDVLANDTDVDGGPRSVTSFTSPANGTVAIVGGATAVTYTPNANYCNTPPGTTPDTFTYQLTPGASVATVSVTVTCVDDPPVAVNDSATVAEDSGATSVDVLANDTDVDGGPRSVTSFTSPANGTVAIVGGATAVTYTPNANYCNTPPGTTPDTFSYTLSPGSSTATVSISVTCADDPPVAVADSATVAEGSAATAIDVLANDTDIDGGPRSIKSTSGPQNGTVVITGLGTGLTYQPDPGYCNQPPGTAPDQFTYTLTPGGSIATVSMTVTCVNNAPAVTSGGTLAYAENDPATPIDATLGVADSDSPNLAGATVAITANHRSPEDVLALANPGAHPGILAALNGTGDTLTLSGSASVAAYQSALRDVTYLNSSDNPSNQTRTVTFTVSDGALTGSATRNIAVTPVDDAPLATADNATVSEDSGANTVDVLANDVDVDGGSRSVQTVTQGTQGGAVGIVPGGTGVTYTPAANFCNTYLGGSIETFTYTLNGSSSTTVAMTVTCQPDPPNVTTSAGTLTYVENAAATTIDPAVTVADPDPDATIVGATVRISSNFALGQDVLALSGAHAPITAGFSGDTLTLSGSASPAAYQAALRNVTFSNTSDNPLAPTRTVTFTVTDNTALTDSATKDVAIQAVDDPPVAVNDSATVLEDSGANAIDVLANDTDVDGGPRLVQGKTDGANGTVTISGGGASVTYTPAANYCGPDTFTYTVNGGSTANVSITVTCVNDNPAAVDDAFNAANSAVGNTALVIDAPGDGPPAAAGPKKSKTGNILANDADVDGPNTLVLVAGTFVTNDGGSVVIEADGDFVFTPAPGTSCSDTSDFFDYTVTDGNTPTAGTDVGRVNVTISGCVWYVNNNAPGNAGTSTAPFDTLAQAETASAAGSDIFVFDGDNTSTGLSAGVDLDSNQRLIGEAADLVVSGDTLWTGDPAKRPVITDPASHVVVLASGNTVRGVQLDPQGASAIAGAAGDASGTIDDVRIIDTPAGTTSPLLSLNGTTGTWNVSNLTVDNTTSAASATGVLLNNAGTVNFQSAGTISIQMNGGKGLDASGTNMGTSTFDDITVTNSASGAVRMLNTTGTTTFGDNVAGDLSLQTTSGAAAAFDLNNAGTVTVQSGGTGVDTISATGGPAVDIQNTNGSTFQFGAVSSTNSSGDAINFAGNGTTTFTGTSAGTIAGAAGIAVDVSGGSGDFTYSGTIANGAGDSARVQSRTGGTVLLNGPINDSSDNGGGVTVTGNSGGTTQFSGAVTDTFNTGTADAVTFTASDGHTLRFVVNALDIDTTSGRGLFASGSGTLEVSGSGSTIDSVSNTALNVTDTDISANGATFQRIASGNNTAAAEPVNGIVLNNTGTSIGGLTVVGSGGACATTGDACSGATIQSTTGDALSLTTTRNVSLTRMKIVNNLGNGIRGSGVTNFAIADSVVDNNADDAATDEAGLHFTNLAGTSGITRTLVANSLEDNARIINSSGTLSQLNVTDSTFRDTDTVSPGNNGLLLQADGGSITADVLGSTFMRNRANGLQVVTNGTGSMNVEVDDSAGVQSTFDDNNIGVSIAHNSSGTFSYAVRDLTIDGLNVAPGTGGSASPININLAGFATTPMVGTVSGNTITNSNSLTGPGIRMNGNGNATLTSLVDANVISAVANRGIEIIARDGSNRINATVTNNSVTLANALAIDAIRVDAGTTSTDTTTICADIRGNTATTAGAGTFGIRVRQRFAGTTFILEDYTGAPANDAAVQTFLSTNNNAATTSADHAGAGFTTTADCPTPP